MKKLPKSEKKIHKVYWLEPKLNKELKKQAKILGYSESLIVQVALEEWLNKK